MGGINSFLYIYNIDIIDVYSVYRKCAMLYGPQPGFEDVENS